MRRAMTLVETMVVIAIVATLVGLLLPAVQKVREAAARIQCSANLRQVGLAAHGHHDTLGALPSGGLGYWQSRTWQGGAPADYRTQAWGFAYQLLPFLEQGNLWREPSDDRVGATALPVYTCPSVGPVVQTSWVGTRALACYGGNAGSWATTTRFDYPSNSLDGALLPSGRPLTLLAITAGTSNVLLVGEKYRSLSGVPQCSEDQGAFDGWDNDTLVTSAATPVRSGGPGTCAFAAGSSHPAGMNALRCDGSVGVVGYSVSQPVFARMCRRDGP